MNDNNNDDDIIIQLYSRYFTDIYDENNQLINYQHLQNTLPVDDFVSVLHESPHMVLKCLIIGVHSAIIFLKIPIKSYKINVRLTNYTPLTPLRLLKSNLVEKYISISGNVVRVTNVKPIIISMEFECSKCGYRFIKKFIDGIYSPPTSCESQDDRKCRGRIFIPDRSTAIAVDFQLIKVQEIVDASEQDKGRIPRNVEVELTCDLVDCCVPGDIVKVSGIVKARKLEQRGGGNRARRGLYMLYIDANNVINENSEKNTKTDTFSFDDNDYAAIIAIANEPNLFKYLVNCLCPSIYGHEVVKAGMLLCLFGGTSRTTMQRGVVNVRENIHILVVGDPGLGKSQLLRAVSSVSARGVYVCGNTSSTTGLTVTMVRGTGDGEFALEAGALVLGDEGVCCIDEFDKMSGEHNSLLEAMEQQCISIAKAGIVCTLSARTSVIAAANPVSGHYDKNRTVAENLKMSAPLLSRFDMIFILMDKPDEDNDQRISEHIINLHSGFKSALNNNNNNNISWTPINLSTQLQSQSQQQSQYDEWKKSNPLNIRLKLNRSEKRKFDPIPNILLSRYIAYARKFVHPVLSWGAKKVLRDFYLQLRKDHQGQDGTPITTRQLESLIRMAEARAKCELREVVTKDDAIDVIDIMKDSLHDFFSDELGHLDFKRGHGGMSKAKQVSTFIKALHKTSETLRTSIFTRDELYDLSNRLGLNIDNFGQFIDTLNDNSYILKKGPRKYQLASSNYSQ